MIPQTNELGTMVDGRIVGGDFTQKGCKCLPVSKPQAYHRQKKPVIGTNGVDSCAVQEHGEKDGRQRSKLGADR